MSETSGPPPSGRPDIAVLVRKELRETLRDRRTILTLVLMPVLVYPLLGLTFQKFLVSQIPGQEKPQYIIGFETEDELTHFSAAYSQAEQLRPREEEPVRIQGFLASTSKAAAGAEDPIRAMFEEAEIDLAIRVRTEDLRRRARFEIIVPKMSLHVDKVARRIEDRLRNLNETILVQRIRRAGGDAVPPISVSNTEIDLPAAGGVSLAALVPLVLLLMTVTGAVYPAIDLTAGERERGTLEALIAAPLPRLGLLTAKYTAVVTVAMLTALVNLTSMFATLYATGLDGALFGDGDVSFWIFPQLLGLLLVFTGFFAAVLLAITSLARSFKEAQAYLIPLMLLSLAPGIIALLPGLKLGPGLAVTPLLNIVLLTRDLFGGEVPALEAALVISSTIVYAVVALNVAARVFGTDAILYGSTGTWGDLFRRPKEPTEVASSSALAMCLAVLIPVFVLLSGFTARIGATGSMVLVAQSVVMLSVFFGLPLLVALWTRTNIGSGFRIHGAKPRFFLVATLWGLSLWTVVFTLSAWLFELTGENPDNYGRFGEIIKQLMQTPFLLRLLAFGLIPPICEELFFRGFVFGAMRKRFGPAFTIAVTSLLFAGFHILVADGLHWERFPPSLLMGLALGYLCEKSGSVLPGILLHAAHNSLLLTLQENKSALSGYGYTGNEVPLMWVAMAAVPIVAGVLLVRLGKSDGGNDS